MKFLTLLLSLNLLANLGASLALAASVANADVSQVQTGENLIEIADIVSKSVSGSAQLCAAPEAAGKSTRASRMSICLHLQAYADSTQDLTFTKSDPVNPCVISSEWKDGLPPWSTAIERAPMAVYATAKAVPTTRNQMLALKWRTRTESERSKYLEMVEGVRDKIAVSCCGADARCTAAMKAVRVTSCVSDADRDPSLPDKCTLLTGSFDFNAGEKLAVKSLIFGESFIRIQSGAIILSPYQSIYGEALAPMKIIKHELGHACSFIQRQAAASEFPSQAQKNATKSLMAWHTGACNEDPEIEKSAYRNLLNGSGLDPRVGDCVTTLARRSIDHESTAFFENSCPVSKVEEGMAEAFSMTQAESLVPDPFPNWLCSAKPSTRHPALADVFACVIKNDTKMRGKLANAYGCKGVR